ncbi:MAG: HAMP domain-containing histidine kinase [Myxococcales bacterium]|nr:HAMP domain-containing histidine kinase [Myxococcales bacterium]
MVRPRATVLVKLLGAFAVPTLALFALFAVIALEVTRRDLDAELGHRLAAVAAATSTQLRGKYLVELALGDTEDRAYKNVAAKLEAVAAATGAHLYVIDRDFAARADSDPAAAIGGRHYRAELDRLELERVFAGATASSVTFEGAGGVVYKAGYAPIHASETEPEIVLALGVEAPAAYFDRLRDLRRSLVWWGAGLTAVVLAATFLAALFITRPVRQLAAAAARIGGGDLTAPVARASRDELGVLADTMDAMRRQLAERDAHMQQMLAGIAHEVRNPLAGIQLYAGILRDELDGDPRAAHAGKIDREVGYLERVVRDFLDFARRPPPELDPVDVAALAREVAELAGPEAAAAGLELEVEAPPALTISADAGQLRRALLNLVGNAVAAAAEVDERGAAVRVTVASDGERLTIEVWNRGPTIPPEVAARMFEPFFTTREKGTGLGLAFVAEIVRAHGGAVTVDSARGETRFRIALPRSRAA